MAKRKGLGGSNTVCVWGGGAHCHRNGILAIRHMPFGKCLPTLGILTWKERQVVLIFQQTKIVYPWVDTTFLRVRLLKIQVKTSHSPFLKAKINSIISITRRKMNDVNQIKCRL